MGWATVLLNSNNKYVESLIHQTQRLRSTPIFAAGNKINVIMQILFLRVEENSYAIGATPQHVNSLFDAYVQSAVTYHVFWQIRTSFFRKV